MQTKLFLLLLIPFVACIRLTTINADSDTLYALINISGVGDEKLNIIKHCLQFQEHTKWIELGSQLFVSSKLDKFDIISQLNAPFTIVQLPTHMKADSSNIFVARGFHQSSFENIGYVLVRGYGYTVFQPYSDQQLTIQHPHRERFFHFSKNLELVRHSSNRMKSGPAYPLSIQDLVDSIDETRWYTNLETLTGWNRYFLSSQFVTAQTFLFDLMNSIPNLKVTLQSFTAQGHTTNNVIGTLKGSVDPNKMIIIGGHYDAISPQPYTAAPGAEDNGSGAVSVIELANVFSQIDPPYTMVFICYSAEEEGLYGSDFHASNLVELGEDDEVVVAHIMDMVGYWDPNAEIPEVLLETSTSFSYLQPFYEQAAATYSQNGLQTALSLDPFGSDHIPYIQRNIPSLLIIDNFWDVYPAYHQVTDTIDKINTTIAMDIMRMNVAAIASFMNSTISVNDAVSTSCNWMLALFSIAGLILASLSL